MSLSAETTLDSWNSFPGLVADGVQCRPEKTSRKVMAYEADTLSDEEWDAIAAGFDDVSYEQTGAYCSARWGEKKNSHLLLREGGEIVAAARVLELKIPGLEKGLAYVKFGPLWRRANQQPDPRAYCSILDALAEEYCNKRGLVLSILPRANPEFSAQEKVLLEANGFTNRKPVDDPARYLVNLPLDEETQFSSLGQSWRRNLRKSRNFDLDIGFADGDRAFEKFQSMHTSMVTRKNAAKGDAVHLLPHLRNALPEGLAPTTVIASHEGKPVAGAIIALNGDTAYYLYGATTQAALPLRAGYALQWWIVRWLSDQGPDWYDLGGTGGDSGLNQFKTGLVGRQGQIVDLPGEFVRWNTSLDRMAADVLFSLRTCRRRIAGLQLPKGWK